MRILKKILKNPTFYTKKLLRKIICPPIQIFEQLLFDAYRLIFKVRVFDCFIFHNELDLLKLRLEYLKNTVDIFVLVEAKLTFTNKNKKNYFAKSLIKEMPTNLRKKIRYIQLEPEHFPPEIKNNAWRMEEFIRNAILFGLKDVRYFDFLWISDIDEIPNKNKVYKLGILSMFFSYYKMNLLKSYFWKSAKAILGKHIKNSTPQLMREKKWENGINIRNGGWHFSYLMTKENIRKKVQSFSHTEYDNEKYISLEKIEESIRSKKDLFGRANEDLSYKSDLTFLPDIIKNNIDDYRDLLEF